MAKDLPAAFESFVEEHVSEWRTKACVQTGRFMDEEDLVEKYKNKPLQLASIFDKAETRFCKIRGVKLWEDAEYVTKDESGEAYRKGTTRRLKQEQGGFVKKAKAARSSIRHTHTAPETQEHTSGPGRASGAP